MTTLKYLFVFTICIVSLSACEDVIELDLEDSEPQLVIEGTLDASNNLATVILSQSDGFYDDVPLEKVTNANVLLQSEKGISYVLEETTPGTYMAENILTDPDENFELVVEVAGISYTASSKVPQAVSIDSLERLEVTGPSFGMESEGSIRIAAIWDDPAGTDNFYRIRSYVNDVFQADQYTVFADNVGGDGQEQYIPLREPFEENTTVTVELLSTDEGYYDYFFQIASVVGDGFNSTTPYNPTNSFNQEVLGYFGIFYASSLTIEL